MSNAQQIKCYFRELLADYKEHSRTELFDYAQEKASDEVHFTNGMLTGALKTLVTDEIGYQCVSRGIYQKVSAAEDDQKRHVTCVIDEYKKILENALLELDRKVQVSPFAMLDMTESDKAELRKIQNCMEVIRNTIQKA